MKRQILIVASVLALLLAGAVFAQSPQNTTAPGPTQQREPGQTNNNLPNPGNPQTDLSNRQTTGTNTTSGTVEGSAAESMDRTQQGNTTGTTPPADTTPPATTLNNEDVTTTTPPTTETTTETTTSTTYGNDTNAADTSSTLPSTASELPALALLGLLALGTAFAVRAYRKA